MATPFTGGASAGLAAAACSAMVGAAIGAAITFTNECLFAVLDLAGGLAGAGITYGLTGEATFNILNISDFGAGAGSGLLELSISKNRGISSRIGTGGTDISAGTLVSAYAGLKEADKVLDWKYGIEEQRSTLNAINMLGYTESESNLSIAKDIWNEDTKVKFADLEGNALGRADKDNNEIYISKKLLEGGKEGSAQVASMFSQEGLHLNGSDEMQSRIGGYETYSQLQKKFKVTGETYDSISDIAYMTEIYKQYGDRGVFTELFFSDAFSQENIEKDFYLAEVVDIGWRQNESINRGIKLGQGFTEEQVDEYNNNQKQAGYQKYKKQEFEIFQKKEGNEDVKYEDFTSDKSFEVFNDTDAKQFGYTPTSFNDLYNYACTLSTAAYMAYSITGVYSSLQEANSLLSEKNVFAVDYADGQKNSLNYGETYAKAVNVLAKANYDVIEYSKSQSNNQTSIQTKEMEKFLLELQNDTENEFYVHLRTNSKNHPDEYNYYSVLMSGIEQLSLNGVPENIKEIIPTVRINILDPAGQYTSKDVKEIGRANAYKLTEYGRVYKGQKNINVPNKLQYINYMYSQHNYYKYGLNDYAY